MERRHESHKGHAGTAVPRTCPGGCDISSEGQDPGRLWSQFHEETMAWLRSLEFLRQENIHLKNRLAEVVDGSVESDFLAQAEHFQNQFILRDEYLDEMRHDINGQERSLQQGRVRRMDAGMDERLRLVQRRLRGQMDYLERECTGLRNQFNDFVDARL